MKKKPKITALISPAGEILGYEVESEPEYCGGGCGKESLHCGLYMVQDDLWETYGNRDGIMCLDCLSNKLQRLLRPEDFKDVPANACIFAIFRNIEDNRPDRSGGEE